jgi:hypothetical protein
MSDPNDPAAQPPSQPDPGDPGDPGAPGPEQQMTPEQEEMLRQMEEEMARVRVQDLITQSVVSILNLAARRIAKEDERDLEQGRIGIEAVRALVDLLEPEAQREVRNALSQIQMMYAQEAGGSAPGAPGAGGAEPGGGSPPPPPKPSSGLWTPGSD